MMILLVSHSKICHQLRKISTSVYKFVTWNHFYNVYKCHGPVTVTGGMKTIGKIGWEPGVLCDIAFIVR